MPAVTDLTWEQLNTSLKQILGTSANPILIDSNSGKPTTLDLPALMGGTATSDGVLKALSILLEAGRRAQETANSGKVAGERLSAFPAPTNGAPANNFVPITRTLTTRADLSSATRIVGTNV